ncbi:Threonine transporter RhtB [Candidatus Desulfarcum epimagneticum]|uniref:Threonine transporter RhtB n=1 Tax=uncultured Desulfobacteraceae bacterium TaxID=218296 RepID=A0A484HHZ0_9BACT|nr:Threonine transporter RhtB [uncultured Desulfobacteraceae bacterium]
MMPPDVMLTFVSASILLALAPGPDNIFVLTQSALRGKKAGIAVMLGLCSGLVVHTTAVALGVAALFQTSALAFSALKFMGAAYLAYLAWQAFRASPETMEGRGEMDAGLWRLYGRGIVMNITNPKVSIFFLAFLPQFADPARGSVAPQIFILGGLFILATLLVFGSVALMAGALGQWLARSPGVRKNMSRVAGMVFLGLAFKLAAATR